MDSIKIRSEDEVKIGDKIMLSWQGDRKLPY